MKRPSGNLKNEQGKEVAELTMLHDSVVQTSKVGTLYKQEAMPDMKGNNAEKRGQNVIRPRKRWERKSSMRHSGLFQNNGQ